MGSNTTLKIDQIVKKKLDIVKEEEGCKSYSDAINILFEKYLLLKEKLKGEKNANSL